MDLLNRAIAAHQQGDLAQAEGLYTRFLQEENSYVAKQLLGLVYSAQGKLEDARQMMLESLAMEPNQPVVHNNIANCYSRLRQVDTAIEHYRRAIALKSDYLDAYQNLAIALLGRRDFEEARQVVDKGLKISPREAALHNLSGLVRKETGDYAGAIRDFESALALRPDYSLAAHNLGVAYRLNNQPALALQCYSKLIESGMNNFELLHNVANAHADLGQLEEAVDYYRKVIEINPLYVDAHKNLSTLLWSLDEREDFLDSYETLFASNRINDDLALAYLETLLSVERAEEIPAFLARYNVTDPADARYCDLLGRAHRAMGDFPNAINFHERACLIANSLVAYRLNYGIALLVAGRVHDAVHVLEAVVAAQPDNQSAIAHLCLCWRILGDEREKRYFDYDRFVGEYDLPIEPGYRDATDFNQKLNAYLTSVHTSKHHPFLQTLRGGTQTQGNLFAYESKELEALVAGLRSVVQDHIDRLAQAGTPVMGFEATRSFDFSASWSVRLRSEGYHTMHIHPMGRISSVYYVDLPDVIPRSDNKSGWLKFGEPNLELPYDLPAEHFVAPRVGKLVLFPSYMWHGTIPFTSSQPRTTVAFDVIPRTGSR